MTAAHSTPVVYLRIPAVVAAASLLASLTAPAATLYSHTFDGGTDSLGLVGPDVANTGTILGANHGTSTANWAVTGPGASAQQNGLTTDDIQAQLAFTPVDGFVYTLEILSTVNTSNAWLGGGFLDNSAGDRVFETGIAWAFNRGSNSNVAHFNATGGLGNIGSTGSTSATESFTIVLDTRDGGGLWDFQYFYNGSSTAFATRTDIGTTAAGNIDLVGFGSEGATNDIQSFTLSVTIPEPSIALLGALGTLLLLRRRPR